MERFNEILQKISSQNICDNNHFA